MSMRMSYFGTLSFLAAFLWLLFPTSGAQAAETKSKDGIWASIDREDLTARKRSKAKAWIQPEKMGAFELDVPALEEILARAPSAEDAAAKILPELVLSFPMPDGTFQRFSVVEVPTMDAELEEWMADQGWPMKTYRGTSLDNEATTVSFDWGGPAGFHAAILAPESTVFIDPYWQGDRTLYASYFKSDYKAAEKNFRCDVVETSAAAELEKSLSKSTSGFLRTYRLAVAATGEYTAFHGGTKAQGQAAIVTSINRVNGIYERELSVRMILVANNNNVVYTNGANDPYSNANCSNMLAQNQTNLDNVIGTANYDIGHVFSTGGGGVASLRSPCNANQKARGCTGTSNPVGDPFDVDFVAHELGHQWGADHTWNGTNNNCTTAQWASSSAYEPGSGSTIMGYAGICRADDLQPNSDDYFHRQSLDQMMGFINFTGTCNGSSFTNPSSPFVDAGPSFTIPQATPFELTARNGSDADGDILTYNWEQFDLGTQAALTRGDDGIQPIFRSWPPSTRPTRTFPRLEDLLANTISKGETLPTTNRLMFFQVTVRDNRPGGGRENNDLTLVLSTTSSGPFTLSFPNGGEKLSGRRTVTWNVANTTASPVSASQVDILLSIDGGMTYPFVLAAATPNDGSEEIRLPDIKTTKARLKVKGTNNIFFDISNADFTLNPPFKAPVMAVVLDRTGSMDAFRSTGNTRCADALTLAVDDISDFEADHPGGFVTVWTFAGSSPVNLTGGFADPADAKAIINALSPTGCSGSTPLAEAMCAAADQIATVGVPAPDKLLAVSSDGGENNSSGECAGPSSFSTTAPYDLGSWQNKVHAKLAGQSIVLARFWNSVARPTRDLETGEALLAGKVTDLNFFEQLSVANGGVFHPVVDSEPLPPTFFSNPLVNGGFETNGGLGTAEMRNWQIINLPGSQSDVPGTGDWVIQSGKSSPLSTTPVPEPPEGDFAAMADHATGAGSHVLYQDIRVPLRGTFLCNIMVNNPSSAFLQAGTLDFEGAPNQHARIDIMDPTAPIDDVGSGVLLNVFKTRPGDRTVFGYTPISTNLKDFAGQIVRLRFAATHNQSSLQMGIDACEVSDEPIFVDGFELGLGRRWTLVVGQSQ